MWKSNMKFYFHDDFDLVRRNYFFLNYVYIQQYSDYKKTTIVLKKSKKFSDTCIIRRY